MKKVELPSQKGFDLNIKTVPGKGLSGRFMVPPFSILRTADADWLSRRRQWLKLGIKSEVGRDETLLFTDSKRKLKTPIADVKRKAKQMFLDTSKGEKWEPGKDMPIWQNTGTSIFDPVLCELLYSWFCPAAGQIVDPFAGGSVRGIVANYLGLRYWGSELRLEQVNANLAQENAIIINKEISPVWVCGDAFEMLPSAPKADFVFSCPPYGDLEVYSDLEADLSNKEYDVFIEMYRNIIKKASRKLRWNRFACFVVSNFRDKKTGFYHDFVGDTVKAFEDSGLHYYNEGILVNSIGSLPLRAGKQFNAGRKFGKMHQNILVFYKGDDHNEIKNIFINDKWNEQSHQKGNQ